MSVLLQPVTQDEDGKSECEAEESENGAESGFVVDDGYLSASEVRNDVDGDGDDAADGEPDGEPSFCLSVRRRSAASVKHRTTLLTGSLLCCDQKCRMQR